MRVKAIFAGILALSIGLAAPAKADTGCGFTLNNVAITWDGWLNIVASTGGVTRSWWLCNVSGSAAVSFGNGQTGSVNSESCRAIYAKMLTAHASNKVVGMWFIGINDCSAASLPADGTISRYPVNFWL
jgi:hypothetical protein